MNELELQAAVEAALALVERGEEVDVALVLEIVGDPRAAAEKLLAIAHAVVKLGGGTVRPRTQTARGVPPPPKP